MRFMFASHTPITPAALVVVACFLCAGLFTSPLAAAGIADCFKINTNVSTSQLTKMAQGFEQSGDSDDSSEASTEASCPQPDIEQTVEVYKDNDSSAYNSMVRIYKNFISAYQGTTTGPDPLTILSGLEMAIKLSYTKEEGSDEEKWDNEWRKECLQGDKVIGAKPPDCMKAKSTRRWAPITNKYLYVEPKYPQLVYPRSAVLGLQAASEGLREKTGLFGEGGCKRKSKYFKPNASNGDVRAGYNDCANQYILALRHNPKIVFEAQGNRPHKDCTVIDDEIERRRCEAENFGPHLCQPLHMVKLSSKDPDLSNIRVDKYLKDAAKKLKVKIKNTKDLPKSINALVQAFGHEDEKKTYERIYDPSHPFSPRHDFKCGGIPLSDRLLSPLTILYEKQRQPSYSPETCAVACAGVPVDILSFRRDAFVQCMGTRIAINNACNAIEYCKDALLAAGKFPPCSTRFDMKDNVPGLCEAAGGKITECCEELRKPVPMINVLKLRPYDERTFPGAQLPDVSSATLASFRFSKFFGPNMPYMRRWDTGKSAGHENSTEKQNPYNIFGTMDTIVGVGRERQICRLGGSSKLTMWPKTPDPNLDWMEYKLYPARSMWAFGIACIPKNERTWKMYSTEDFALTYAVEPQASDPTAKGGGGGKAGTKEVFKQAVKNKMNKELTKQSKPCMDMANLNPIQKDQLNGCLQDLSEISTELGDVGEQIANKARSCVRLDSIRLPQGQNAEEVAEDVLLCTLNGVNLKRVGDKTYMSSRLANCALREVGLSLSRLNVDRIGDCLSRSVTGALQSELNSMKRDVMGCLGGFTNLEGKAKKELSNCLQQGIAKLFANKQGNRDGKDDEGKPSKEARENFDPGASGGAAAKILHPLSWRGYASGHYPPVAFPFLFWKLDIKNFESLSGITNLFSLIKATSTGMDTAQPGDILVYNHHFAFGGLKGKADNRIPVLSYVDAAEKTPSGIQYVKIREWNNGKVPDICGNTEDLAGDTTTRTLYKKQLPDAIVEAHRAAQVKTSTCYDPDLEHCIETLWDRVLVFHPLSDHVGNTLTTDYQVGNDTKIGGSITKIKKAKSGTYDGDYKFSRKTSGSGTIQREQPKDKDKDKKEDSTQGKQRGCGGVNGDVCNDPVTGKKINCYDNDYGDFDYCESYFQRHYNDRPPMGDPSPHRQWNTGGEGSKE